MKIKNINGVNNPNYKHGGKGTRLYSIWKGFRLRCNSPSSSVYKYYGGRGIGYHPDWESFILFRDWSLLNGYSENLSLDRINSNGNYEPNNCRWATSKQQNNNSRNNSVFNINGVNYTMSQLCEKYKISPSKLSARVTRLGWPIEKAIKNVNTKLGTNKTHTHV